MPSLFHLVSRKIISQIKWPHFQNEADVKELQAELHSVLHERQSRKNSSIGG